MITCGAVREYAPPPMANGYIKSPCSHGQGAYASCGGGVAVVSEQGFAGPGESFQVDLMTNAVSRSREVDAIPLRDGLQIGVIVCVFESYLDGIVINVADGKLGGNSLSPMDSN